MRKLSKELYKLDTDTDKNFTLERLSDNLRLSVERSQHIYNLYEKTLILKNKSDQLSQDLSKEKSITQTQSEFISLVSHEFKTPLAIIKTSMDVLKRIVKNYDDKFIEQINKVEKAIIRINKMMDSTLNLSKLESGNLLYNPEFFILENLILDIIKRHEDINPEVKITLKTHINNENYYGDKNLTDLIFNNLISNSIKYSKAPAIIDITYNIIDDFHYINITDQGIGISKKDLEKICTKFFRAENATGISGTGIGLYLVKKLVELHKGNFTIESEENIGSKFHIYFPIKH